jgi:membrane-bound ClpP family serine protease
VSGSPDPDRPSRHVILRYVAFQVPGFALACAVGVAIVTWLSVPVWAAATGVFLWTLKDVVMFPFVWRAYAPRVDGGPHDLRGRTGRSDGDGFVRLGAERWRARAVEGFELGDGATIRVVELDGLTLVVEPAEDETG